MTQTKKQHIHIWIDFVSKIIARRANNIADDIYLFCTYRFRLFCLIFHLGFCKTLLGEMGIESGYETDTRLYFDKEKLFLCKLTYPNDGPAGSIPGQITELPCSELHHIVRSESLNESQRAAEAFTIAESIDGLLAHGRKLLSTANTSTNHQHQHR